MLQFVYLLVVGGTFAGLFFVSAGFPGPASGPQFITTDMLQIVEPDPPRVKIPDRLRPLSAFASVLPSEKVLDGRAAWKTQRSQDSLQVGRKGSRPNGNAGDQKHLQRRNHVQRRIAREDTW